MSSKHNANKIVKIFRFLCDPDYRFLVLAGCGFYDSLSDEEYIRRKFHAMMGFYPNLDDPHTFNEKLQWLKLHDRKPEYVKMVDKYEVKKYVADIIGEEYIIPTLGVWDRFENIDFSQLPDQFVLKCTHDSGGIVICKDKSKLDIQAAKTKINKSLNRNYYYVGREWPYKNVKPRIIAEPYLTDESRVELNDYKIHCFHGEPKVILVCQDRYSEEGLAEDFFDTEWNYLDMQRPGQRHCSNLTPQPEILDQMLEISKDLSKDEIFLRVDFYVIKNKPKIGELTIYPASGFKAYQPKEWDYKLGSWI